MERQHKSQRRMDKSVKREQDPMRETQQGKFGDETTQREQKASRFQAPVGSVNLGQHLKRRNNNNSMEEGKGIDININYEKLRWPTFPHNVVLHKKNSVFLPQSSSEIHKMFGLVRGPASFNHDFAPANQPSSGAVKEEENQDQGEKVKVVFDIDFECANAEQIRRKNAHEFHVFMRPDSNSSANLQWFAFRMRNAPDFLGKIKIIICNFTKANSLFNRGMQPSFFSKKAHDQEGEDWFQAGTNVKYEESEYSSEMNHMNPQKHRNFMQLSFDFQFMIGGDEVFCCYTVPYTYSECLAHLEELKKVHSSSPFKFIRFQTAGRSIAGFDIPILKISNSNPNYSPMKRRQKKTDKEKSKKEEKEKDDYNEPEYLTKPVIFIIGRQHCGETHSSFIIHGLINFLCSRNMMAHKLREVFDWWICPVVNPDGIICGNYRTNLQGKDMNRHFFNDDDQDALKHGRVHEVEVIRDYLKQNIPLGDNMFKMFLDIHAHSAQTSIFIYSPLHARQEDSYQSKRFTLLLDDISDYFQFDNCRFNNAKAKWNCARLGIHRDWNLIDSYTIESSCFGFEVKANINKDIPAEDRPDPQLIQFNEDQFLEFGEQLAIGVAKHYRIEVTDADRASMVYGLDIELDYGLHIRPVEPEPEVLKKKAQQVNKKSTSQLQQQTPVSKREEKKVSPRNQPQPPSRQFQRNIHSRSSNTTRDTSQLPLKRMNSTVNSVSDTQKQRNSRLGSATKSSEAKKRIPALRVQSRQESSASARDDKRATLSSFEINNQINLPGEGIKRMNNCGVVTIMNQSQRDYYARKSSLPMGGKQYLQGSYGQSIIPFNAATTGADTGTLGGMAQKKQVNQNGQTTEFEQALLAHYSNQEQATRSNLHIESIGKQKQVSMGGGNALQGFRPSVPPGMISSVVHPPMAHGEREGLKEKKKQMQELTHFADSKQLHRGDKKKTVVITIKQQGADGKAQQIPEEVLKALQMNSNGKTVFKAKVDLDGKGSRSQPMQLSEDLISGLIRDVHAKQHDPRVEAEKIRREKQAQLAEERRQHQAGQQQKASYGKGRNLILPRINGSETEGSPNYQNHRIGSRQKPSLRPGISQLHTPQKTMRDQQGNPLQLPNVMRTPQLANGSMGPPGSKRESLQREQWETTSQSSIDYDRFKKQRASEGRPHFNPIETDKRDKGGGMTTLRKHDNKEDAQMGANDREQLLLQQLMGGVSDRKKQRGRPK